MIIDHSDIKGTSCSREGEREREGEGVYVPNWRIKAKPSSTCWFIRFAGRVLPVKPYRSARISNRKEDVNDSRRR